MSGLVDGKVALITAAARGQGRSHARRLAEEGASIIAVDICHQIESVPYALATPADLEQTVKEIEAVGGRVVAAEVDVRDFDALEGAVNEGVRALGGLDIVSVGAGVWTGGTVADMSIPEWRDVIDVTLTGAWQTAKIAVPHIVAGGRGGSIVFTSSVCGSRGYANLGSYVAAKHGLTGLMRTLALELAQHRIRVNVIQPTQVDTLMIQNDALWTMFVPDVERPTKEDFAPISQSLNALPVPWVEPEDITNALMFLVADTGRFVTGASIPIDAGSLIK